MKNLAKKLKISLAVISIVTILSTSIVAKNISVKGPISFSVYDTNNNNLISENEFYEARALRMSQKANQNRPMKKAGNAPDFNSFDTNNDGSLTKTELLEGQNKQMQRNRENRGSKQKSQINNKNNRQGNGKNMRQNMPTFESYDLNADGYLTQKEIDKARIQRMQTNASQGKILRNSGNQTKFSNIDTNKDGKVDKQEFLSNQKRKR